MDIFIIFAIFLKLPMNPSGLLSEYLHDVLTPKWKIAFIHFVFDTTFDSTWYMSFPARAFSMESFDSLRAFRSRDVEALAAHFCCTRCLFGIEKHFHFHVEISSPMMRKNHTKKDQGEKNVEELQTSLHVRYNSWWLFASLFFCALRTKFSGCPVFPAVCMKEKKKLSDNKNGKFMLFTFNPCFMASFVILHQYQLKFKMRLTYAVSLLEPGNWDDWGRKRGNSFDTNFHKESVKVKLKVHFQGITDKEPFVSHFDYLPLSTELEIEYLE